MIQVEKKSRLILMKYETDPGNSHSTINESLLLRMCLYTFQALFFFVIVLTFLGFPLAMDQIVLDTHLVAIVVGFYCNLNIALVTTKYSFSSNL